MLVRGYPSITERLNKMGSDVIQELKKRAPYASGKLSDSITFDVISKDGQFEVGFNMHEWGIYQDEGVNGILQSRGSRFSFRSKMPPTSIIERWVKIKGIVGRDKKGRFMKRKSLAFLISRSIFQKGIPAKNWINYDGLDQRLEELSFDICEDIWDDFYEENNKK